MTDPDISFHATVRARRLRFHTEPRTRVEFFGTAEHESSSDRTNLPERVRPGTTYRDVRVDYRLAAALADPDR
ncbi:hypothetical protein GCM10011581_45750 [Saccharopolyspora subtropica]|uniref:Uncharacterized protein n=1 Tax=Saccharopolyspora thermophila TaxID=89367 RepID=A0A917NIQ7_9PSEU|nr:hypothetical protein [Saccharopolyspora subtropica]GGJ03517.1 hypothetical protein GCM10011581_45750 [Saccharopolyspora subtropica]